MKISSFKFASAALLAVLSLPLATINAQEQPGETSAPVIQAATAAEAWAEAEALFRAIKSAAEAQDGERIHRKQEKLVAALKQLRTKTGGTDSQRMAGAIKNAIIASEKVHHAADANEWEKVEASLKTLETTMEMVEKQVPKSAK